MQQPWGFSPWVRDVDPATPALDGSLEVDVAIIGAGFTGLSAALELREAGMTVALLESKVAGCGASGRSAGHLTPTIGKDLPTLVRLFGVERAREFVELAELAIRYTESRIERHRIDCAYEAVGNVFAAIHETQFGTVDRAAEAAQKVGLPGEVLEPEQMRQRALPPAFLRGYFERSGGLLNPALYVRGLRRAALERGAHLFENTPVTLIETGRHAVLHSPQGQVRAPAVVVATNAYTNGLGAPVPPVAKLHVQLFKTERLSDEQLARLGWNGREGVYTAHEILESYRLTADRCLVGGSKFIRYAFGKKDLVDADSNISARMERVFRARFPGLDGVGVAHHWGGAIAFNVDFLPLVGRAGPHGNFLYSLAYAGHGIAQASYAGRMIRDLMLEQDGPGAVLYRRRPWPLPPEPLRWAVARGMMRVFRWMDQRVDKQVDSSSQLAP